MSTFSKPSMIVAVTRALSAHINNLADAVETAFGLVPDETKLELGTVNYAGETTGSGNAYVASLTYTPAGFVDGMQVIFKANHTNTGASTLNLNALGAKSMRRKNAAALVAGDLVKNALYDARYNTTTGYYEVQHLTAGNLADIAIVAGIAANVTTVAGISANVTTVAGISANVTTVAGISANVTTVSGISVDVTTVSGISADVTTVAGIAANVTTVAGIASDVTTVAGISADVTTVAGLSSQIAALGLIEIIQASTDTLTAEECYGTIINNYGQGSANTQTLPTAAEGLSGTCVIATAGAGAFNLKAGPSDKIYLDGTALDDGDKVSLATPLVGNTFSFWAFQNGAAAWDWIVFSGTGTLTDGGA